MRHMPPHAAIAYLHEVGDVAITPLSARCFLRFFIQSAAATRCRRQRFATFDIKTRRAMIIFYADADGCVVATRAASELLCCYHRLFYIAMRTLRCAAARVC